MMVYDKVSWEG